MYDGERRGMRRARDSLTPGRVLSVAAVFTTLVLWVFGLVLAVLDGVLAGALAGIDAVGFAVVGALVVWQRPENRLGSLLCLGAVWMTVLGAGGVYANRALVTSPGSLPAGEFVAWLADLMALPTVGLFACLLPQLFPTGRALSPRWRVTVWAAWGFIVLGAVGNAFLPQALESVPGMQNPFAVTGAEPFFATLVVLAGILGAVALAAGVITLVLRWRSSRGEQRQQLKWFVAGVVLLPVPLGVHGVSPGLGDSLFSFILLALAAALGVAVLRHRLYDLDLVLRRAAVYTAVSAVVAGLYLAIVALVELAVGTANLAVHVLAAVSAAAGFQPVRGVVQRGVDRVFHGDRNHPYDALARLGRQLEVALVPETVLPGVVASVAGALRVPFVAIDLSDVGGWVRVAQTGSPCDELVSFAMTYQGEVVGRMLVSPRAPGEKLHVADRELLADLARQAGLVAHAARSTAALQRSRMELVTAREEERRRLRRDLHDGLGPALAGVTFGLHAAQTQVRTDPEETERLLERLEAQVEQTVADVRRLVYGLRPPALDQFGLVRAVQQHAARMEELPERLSVTIDSPAGGLGQLPAAVEVAAYRILTEALTNVARHSQARTCTVRMSVNGALLLDVIDDGRGLSSDSVAGVGMGAMRERAAELGGTLTVTSDATGTRILARLPATEQS
ncbi:MAG TPA: sensor histidine kinase [Dermatophilaceae bacterium]